MVNSIPGCNSKAPVVTHMAVFCCMSCNSQFLHSVGGATELCQGADIRLFSYSAHILLHACSLACFPHLPLQLEYSPLLLYTSGLKVGSAARVLALAPSPPPRLLDTSSMMCADWQGPSCQRKSSVVGHITSAS